MRQRAGVMIGRLLGRGACLAGMVAVVAAMGTGHHVVVDAHMVLNVLAGLLMNRRASHAKLPGNCLKRKQGHEQPNEQFLENAVHCGGEYSTADFVQRRALVGAPHGSPGIPRLQNICFDLPTMGRCTVSIYRTFEEEPCLCRTSACRSRA